MGRGCSGDGCGVMWRDRKGEQYGNMHLSDNFHVSRSCTALDSFPGIFTTLVTTRKGNGAAMDNGGIRNHQESKERFSQVRC